MALIRAVLIRELRELIAALDRRVPQVERAGEASIAHDAAVLKVKALKRIAELEEEDLQSIGVGPNTIDAETSEGGS